MVWNKSLVTSFRLIESIYYYSKYINKWKTNSRSLTIDIYLHIFMMRFSLQFFNSMMKWYEWVCSFKLSFNYPYLVFIVIEFSKRDDQHIPISTNHSIGTIFLWIFWPRQECMFRGIQQRKKRNKTFRLKLKSNTYQNKCMYKFLVWFISWTSAKEWEQHVNRSHSAWVESKCLLNKTQPQHIDKSKMSERSSAQYARSNLIWNQMTKISCVFSVLN